MKRQIREEWNDYYEMLEAIRKSGIVNMFGSAPYLAKYCDIGIKLATEVLISWMDNYDELSEKLAWRQA